MQIHTDTFLGCFIDCVSNSPGELFDGYDEEYQCPILDEDRVSLYHTYKISINQYSTKSQETLSQGTFHIEQVQTVLFNLSYEYAYQYCTKTETIVFHGA